MTTISIETLSEPISIVLCDSGNLYGIKRTDNDILIAVPNTAVTQIDATNYEYSFNDPAYDLEYDYSFKIEYSAGVYTYVVNTVDGVGLVESDLSWISRPDAELYFNDRLFIRVWEEATEREKEKALTMATKAVEQLELYAFTVVPQDLKDAICEIALSLLDGKDPEMEFENLGLVTSQYSSVRSTYDRTVPMEHIEAGIPSIKAWRLIKPYLDVSKGITLSRVS